MKAKEGQLLKANANHSKIFWACFRHTVSGKVTGKVSGRVSVKFREKYLDGFNFLGKGCNRIHCLDAFAMCVFRWKVCNGFSYGEIRKSSNTWPVSD